MCLRVGGGGVESDVLREKGKWYRKIRLKVKKKMSEDFLTFGKSRFLKASRGLRVCVR